MKILVISDIHGNAEVLKAVLKAESDADASIFLGVFDTSKAVISDVYTLFKGKMDIMKIDEGPETATIALNLENRLIVLDRAKERRYTHEDQQLSFAGDLGFEFIFSRQIEGLGSQNDILFGLSTSGNSENVIQGLTSAKELGIKTIGMTGKKIGRMAKIDANELIIIDSDNTARIQEAHLLIGHIICQYVENKLF